MSDYALSALQLEVIDALSSGVTITAAAAQAGVHRNTICNWRRNQVPFQHALAHAQYDRAMLYREKIEELVDLAVETLSGLLSDPKASPSVRLKAALAVVQLAAKPPEPKQQVELLLETVTAAPARSNPGPMHNPAQPAAAPVTTVHNSAPTPLRREHPKIGRNETCPCGSGQKYKRCCLGKSAPAGAVAAA